MADMSGRGLDDRADGPLQVGGLGEALMSAFGAVGGVDLELPVREGVRPVDLWFAGDGMSAV